MDIVKHLRLRAVTWAAVGAAAVAAASALSLTAASAAPVTSASSHRAVSFALVPSPGIQSCLPHARGVVTIIPGSQNDLMDVTISGMPSHAEFDLFVIQQPNKPFGVSWYQSDVQTDKHGNGTVTVRGIFNVETFTVDVDPAHAVAPTHQYHLGLWFNSPAKPFALHCEGAATSPIVTPFNGIQHAGIQILNTSNFPASKGPLAHVKA
jgi:hypothetical protein